MFYFSLFRYQLFILESNDVARWPLRESLFPNVPPYIAFNSYDATTPNKIPHPSNALKWKLSTVTPLIVRSTLTNTGFRLVQSEFSRGDFPLFPLSYHHPFPAILCNQTCKTDFFPRIK